MSPANAERVARRVGVHLVPLFRGETGCGLKHARSESDHLVVAAFRIFDVKVQMDLLLLRSARPRGRSVIRSELHADDPRAIFVEHAMKLFVIGHDVALEYCRPKGALGTNVCRVEHDDVSDQVHSKNGSGSAGAVIASLDV